MDDQQDYFKDSVTLLIELLQDALGGQIKTYYEGAPQQMPAESAFPICSVYKTKGRNTVGATATDEVTEEIMIVIMTNRLIFTGSPSTIDTPMRHLQKLVEGRDPSQPAYFGQYLPNTVLGALRTYLTLGTYTINSDVSVTYDSVARKENPAIAEADIHLVLTETVHIADRR